MKFLEKIFSIKNNENKSHKLITIFGLKIKLKRIYRNKYNVNIPVNNFGINIDNKDVIILGNGHSLKDSFNDPVDYNFIKNKDIFVVNSFMQDEHFSELRPKYLCLMDPAYWDINLKNEKFKIDFYKDKEILKEVSWDLTIFMPIKAQKWNHFAELTEINKNIKFVYINTSACDDFDVYRFIKYKQNLATPIIQNVLIACLYISINLGYKNIYLYGADHSWHLDLKVKNDNILYMRDYHCYENGKSNWFPFYKDGRMRETFSVSEIFSIYSLLYKQYKILEDYSKYMGSHIYNYSKFSYIDAFKRGTRKSTSYKIKLFATDVDGVLTDGGMYYTENSDEFKKFNTRDGMGLSLLRENGIKTAIITSEDTNIVKNRAKKLKIDILAQGIKNKLEYIKQIAQEYSISPDEIAYIGDDINDIEILEYVGMKACPKNAAKQVKSIENIVILNSDGGEGAVREFCEHILGSYIL